MSFQAFTTTFVYSILVAMVVSIVAVSYGQDILGQVNQERTAAATANMTRTDFNALTENLIIARQGLMNNDSELAYEAINTAGNDLFELRQNVAGGDERLVNELTKQLKPEHNNIDRTRDALRDNNATQAIKSLNTADARLLIVTQGLPMGE